MGASGVAAGVPPSAFGISPQKGGRKGEAASPPRGEKREGAAPKGGNGRRRCFPPGGRKFLGLRECRGVGWGGELYEEGR